MSWSDRRAVLAGLALAGCGFAPVYGPQGVARDLQGEIAIDPPRDAAGFAFVRHLESRLGIADAPEWRLAAQLSVSEEELGVTPDQVISRYQLVGAARFSLLRIDTQEVVTSGTVNTFTSYSATGTPFATQTAERDARDRLMVALADKVVSRLLATRGDWP